MTRDEARLIVGPGAVLSVSRAVELLPMRDAAARAAIEAAGIVRNVDGKRLVVWGDVLDVVLQRQEEGEAPKPKRAPLRRAKL